MSPRLLGIRHHSPACARLVAHRIETERPAAVLIEGPADFNARLDELLLGHRLPIALYSYSNGDAGTGQCWFPFVRHSPEWVALTAGRASGAELRFIDLPHWQYRTVSDQERRRLAPAGISANILVGFLLYCAPLPIDGDGHGRVVREWT